MFFFNRNVDLHNDFNDCTIIQTFSIVISFVFQLSYNDELDELFIAFDSIEYVKNFQNDEKNNSNNYIENDYFEIIFRNNDRNIAIQSIRYYENNENHDRIVKNFFNMKNNSRKIFHNNDDVDMNIVSVDLSQFKNSKISETETKKNKKKRIQKRK